MKIGRNELCPCGSGKKYKKCCLGKEEDKKKEEETAQLIYEGIQNLRSLMLKKKTHIKKYHHLRHIHSDILDSMIDYFKSGKYDLNQELKKSISADKRVQKEPKKITELEVFDLNFDPDNDAEMLFFYGLSIYKNSEYSTSITEIYLNKEKFKNKEKRELLEAMNEAYTSIFKIIDTDSVNAYVYLQDVLTGKEYKIIDEGLSNPFHEVKDYYLYTRIITVGDISFGNCSLLIEGTNSKVKDAIQKWKKYGYDSYGLSFQFLRISQNDNKFGYKVNNIS